MSVQSKYSGLSPSTIMEIHVDISKIFLHQLMASTLKYKIITVLQILQKLQYRI